MTIVLLWAITYMDMLKYDIMYTCIASACLDMRFDCLGWAIGDRPSSANAIVNLKFAS